MERKTSLKKFKKFEAEPRDSVILPQGNVLVIFLVVIVTALFLVVSGYLFWQNRQLQKQIIKTSLPIQNSAPINNFPIPIPVSTPTPVPVVDPTANWKTYKLGNVSFKLPQDWIIVKSKFTFKDQYGYDYLFRANSPDYKFTERSLGLAGGMLENGMSLDLSGLNITYLKQKYPQQRYNEKIEDDLNFSSNDPRFKNLASEKSVLELGGQKFALIYSVTPDGSSYRTITYKGDYSYNIGISFITSQKDEGKKFINQILSTFKFP